MNRFNSALMCANKHLINAFVEDHPDQSKLYCPFCGKETFFPMPRLSVSYS